MTNDAAGSSEPTGEARVRYSSRIVSPLSSALLGRMEGADQDLGEQDDPLFDLDPQPGSDQSSNADHPGPIGEIYTCTLGVGPFGMEP